MHANDIVELRRDIIESCRNVFAACSIELALDSEGLALSRKLFVEKRGGQISFESATGRGTTFFVRLPLGEGAACAAE